MPVPFGKSITRGGSVCVSRWSGISGVLACGIPEVGALEGVSILRVAEIGAAPDPVMILKDG